MANLADIQSSRFRWYSFVFARKQSRLVLLMGTTLYSAHFIKPLQLNLYGKNVCLELCRYTFHPSSAIGRFARSQKLHVINIMPLTGATSCSAYHASVIRPLYTLAFDLTYICFNMMHWPFTWAYIMLTLMHWPLTWPRCTDLWPDLI